MIRMNNNKTVDNIYSLFEEGFEEGLLAFTKQDTIENLFKDNNLIYIETNDEIVGVVTFKIIQMIRKPIFCRLLQLYIKKGHRKTGLGTYLLSAIENIAKENKCRYIELKTSINNKPARAFYESNGYIRFNTEYEEGRILKLTYRKDL